MGHAEVEVAVEIVLPRERLLIGSDQRVVDARVVDASGSEKKPRVWRSIRLIGTASATMAPIVATFEE